MFEPAKTFEEMPKSARHAYQRAKQSAKKNELDILSKIEFLEIWNRAEGNCELSNLPFSDELDTGPIADRYVRKNSYPWQPSLDQINPGHGYNASNCQLVCKSVNIGKNSYSQATFERWVLAVAKRVKE